MSAVVFYYRRSEFTTDSQFTIRSVFSTGGSFGPKPSFPGIGGSDLSTKIARFSAVAGGNFLSLPANYQRKRDDNKNKNLRFSGGGGQGGKEEKLSKTLFFMGNVMTIKF